MNRCCVILMVIILFAGCGSSRTGNTHLQSTGQLVSVENVRKVEQSTVFSSVIDSLLSQLTVDVVWYYRPSDSSSTCGPVAATAMIRYETSQVTRTDGNERKETNTHLSDSVNCLSDSSFTEEVKVKSKAWYEPFIPYIIAIIVVSLLVLSIRIFRLFS